MLGPDLESKPLMSNFGIELKSYRLFIHSVNLHGTSKLADPKELQNTKYGDFA